jgi:arsenate reductase (thioredoxin)
LTEAIKDIEFDYVVMVCDSARDNCPFFPAKVRRIHHRFPDPPQMALKKKKESEKLDGTELSKMRFVILYLIH